MTKGTQLTKGGAKTGDGSRTARRGTLQGGGWKAAPLAGDKIGDDKERGAHGIRRWGTANNRDAS